MTLLQTAGAITMDRQLARQKYLAYRRAVGAKRGTKQDQELKRAYRQLSMGRRVLSVGQAIESAGLRSFRIGRVDQQLPRLAICRADLAWCRFDREWSGTGRFAGHDTQHGWESIRGRTIRVPELFRGQTVGQAVCRTPTIPAPLRPKAGLLDRYWILWEAEWVGVPTDPLLLSRIGSDLWVVVAQWDLTPLEQLVLGRAQAVSP